jgi:hypothetical protein
MKKSTNSIRALFCLAAAALTTVVLCCGGGTEVAENPAGASTEEPAATATPIPTATPWVCPFGRGRGTGECPKPKRADEQLFRGMQTAIGAVQNQNPTWFIFHNDGTVQLRDSYRDGFYDAVVDELNAAGFCAIVDGNGADVEGPEIAVKRNNDLSEQYRPWKTHGWIRSDTKMFIAQCRPAWF